MDKKAYSITASELAALGKDQVPAELISNQHLIFSSPATLAFNSPGAQGFGVKRAGLAIPGSVMLLVAPACCGRNTTILSELGGYSDKFFYLMMDETDIVTGRHLRKIPKAVQELYDSLKVKPSVVMICITCVDALLGTDMERVCRKATEKVGVPVLPCYMYALTREGRKPPMVHVRQSLYSLLQPKKKVSTSVNLLGHFAPLVDDCELYDILKELGVKTIRELSRCKTFDEYMDMAEANFNLILNPEARYAAADLQKRLNMPSIELTRLYQIDKIKRQYELFAAALGAKIDDTAYYQAAKNAIDAFKERYPDTTFAIGEGCNANAFELALALLRYGFKVSEIYANISQEDYSYLKKIAVLSPDTLIYSNLEPSMIYYDSSLAHADITVGKDAAYYHPDAVNLEWSEDIQPFGYAGLRRFFEACLALRDGTLEEKLSLEIKAIKPADTASHLLDSAFEVSESKKVKALRKIISPFAPDQSGAVEVFCEMGGLIVIVDAGGCAGNVCGFDEPRWFQKRSAIFSAGLRDMDAILGRDDRMVEKIVSAVEKIDCNFIAIIGTPVPSVIATDYKAIQRMLEKKVNVPVYTVDTNGTESYEIGVSKAYMELCRDFMKKAPEDTDHLANVLGVFGATPMDTSYLEVPAVEEELLTKYGCDEVLVFGMGTCYEDLSKMTSLKHILVVSPSGLEAAKLLEKTYQIPYSLGYPTPWIPSLKEIRDVVKPEDKVLIIHQQVLGNTIREELRTNHGVDDVTVMSWFTMDAKSMEACDREIKEEAEWIQIVAKGEYDVIIADHIFKRAVPGFRGEYIELPHFAVSGTIYE